MSTRERLYRTRAVVLSRRDYSDADRILTIFTPDLGKRELIAKGVRKTTSRKAGHLEPLTHTSLLVAQARTWDIITEAVTVESFRHLRDHLDAIGYASYACELVNSFTQADDESQPLWELLLFVLRTLDEYSGGQTQFEPRLLLRWFDLQLLSLAGFQPQFFHCLGCGKPLQPEINYLKLSEGGVFCPRCGELQNDVEALEADLLKVLRYLQSQPWPEVAKLHVRSHILQGVENILYRYLLTLLEHHLKSTDFLRRLRAMATEKA
jgi:DNA repair protein RecO (recombination protein O)